MEKKYEPPEHKNKKQKPDPELEKKLFAANLQKREYAKRIGKKILMQMTVPEMNLWSQFDSFFNQLTKISSILKPKMPEAEKKQIINEQLGMIEVPDLVYLPTNPRFKV